MADYEKGKVLGQGSFGRALLVKKKSTGEKFVMKEIDVSRMPHSEREAAKLEAKVLQERHNKVYRASKRASSLPPPYPLFLPHREYFPAPLFLEH